MALSENDRHDATLRRKQPPASDAWSFAPILRRRIPLIGLVTLVFALAGLIYVALSVPRYMASGRILVGLPAAEVASQISVMTSPTMLDRVIAREKLEADPQFGGQSKGTLSLLLTGLGLAPSADAHASALRQLERVISVKRDADSSLIDVSALTRDRDMSMRLANAVMDSYIEEQTRAPADATRRAQTPSDAQSGPLQARLKEAEQRYEKYRSEIGSAAANGGPASEKQVNTLSDRLAAAESKVDSLRSRSRRAGVDPDTVRGGTIDVLRSRYAAAKRLQDDLSRTLGPRHPDMVIAKLQTSEAQRLLDQAVRNKAQDRIESDAVELERARTTVADLKGRLEIAKKDAVRAKETSIRLRELERDVEISRNAYQAALTQPRELAERQHSSTPATKIISRAALPSESVGTPRVLVLLISILLGLVAGVALALLLELRPEWASKSSWKSSWITSLKSWPFPRR